VSIPDSVPESFPPARPDPLFSSNEVAPATPDSRASLPDDGFAEAQRASVLPPGEGPVDLNEAARQLELAIHDARVAFDCAGLANLDRAHTFAITARAAIDSAEHILRAALTARTVIQPDLDHLAQAYAETPPARTDH
jgi:hypothetical protein